MIGKKRINGLMLGISEASALLGVSERALRARVSRHQVPYRRFQGRIVFLRNELDEFLLSLPGVTLQEVKHQAERVGVRDASVMAAPG
jgi:hypothetical protein